MAIYYTRASKQRSLSLHISSLACIIHSSSTTIAITQFPNCIHIFSKKSNKQRNRVKKVPIGDLGKRVWRRESHQERSNGAQADRSLGSHPPVGFSLAADPSPSLSTLIQSIRSNKRRRLLPRNLKSNSKVSGRL